LTRSTRLPFLTVLIGAAAVLAARMPTVQSEARADSQPVARLALRMGQWEGTDQPVPADVQRALPTARLLSRRYQSPLGSADVTIITGSDATALHDPHDCLSGNGWEFLVDRPYDVDLGGGRGVIRVRDVVMANGAVRARMWYWYAVGSEIYDSTLPARLGLFRVRLTEGERRPARFVRLIVTGETGSSRTQLMLTDLVRQMAGQSEGLAVARR
jgi:EpsI family protein